jgi:hypothetical protein
LNTKKDVTDILNRRGQVVHSVGSLLGVPFDGQDFSSVTILSNCLIELAFPRPSVLLFSTSNRALKNLICPIDPRYFPIIASLQMER